MANPRYFDTGSPMELTATTHPVWQELETAARTLPAQALPGFLASLEKIRLVAFARLVAPVPAQDQPDELLNIEAASRMLGCSVDYLYHHHDRFSFTRRIGRSLRFSAKEVTRYIHTNGRP